MSWKTIENRYSGNMPEDVVRIGATHLTVSPNISEKFQAQRRTTPHSEVVDLGIAVNEGQKKIRLVPDAISHFAFRTTKNGRALQCSKPMALKLIDMPRGDYILTNASKLEFKLAE